MNGYDQNVEYRLGVISTDIRNCSLRSRDFLHPSSSSLATLKNLKNICKCLKKF